MLTYLLRKTLYGLAVMLGIVVVVFFLFNILPVDPARMTQGQRADVQSLEAVRKEFGLDKSLPVQFAYYLNDLSPIGLHERTTEEQQKYHYVRLFPVSAHKVLALKWPYLRRSYQTHKEVAAILLEVIPNTLILAVCAMLLAIVLGIFLGVLSAVHQNSWIDRLAVGFSVLGISAPSFFAGILIAWLFGFVLSRYTGLDMTGSLHTYDPFKGEVTIWHNLVLPALTLGLRPLAIIVQLTRNSMLEVLSQDYIRTAKAKGLSRNAIVYRHALPNALNPVITAIANWFASLLAGAFFVEYIFGYNGLGKVTVDALEMSDFPVIIGSILFIAFIFVIINILVDIIYVWIDPRVKLN
ncbi:ABC transporter permease [Mucilaginibacter robiniae]|uniref:ABC transporter permease n=1 Tax=Mucilaginibacter robiniae TaxID=2728022 RepID=A0A7L5DXU7_9SPHI|nr:ABC transporter permease [Mucilaginibacter robiniae]QJD95835.1 ABC transporter permease [Mucilaginibacter robiniae]